MQVGPDGDATITTNNNNADKMADALTRRILNIAYCQGVLMETPSGYFKAMTWISDERWQTYFISGEWFSLEYPSLRMLIDGIRVQKITFRAYAANQQQEKWEIDAESATIERRPTRDGGDLERLELSTESAESILHLPADDWTSKNCGARCRHTLETFRHNVTTFLGAQKDYLSTQDLLLLHRLAHQLATMTKPPPWRKATQ